MMPNRGLGAALAGALRGAVGVQDRKRERREELSDKESAQQRLIAQIMLQAKLAEAAAVRSGERQEGRTVRGEERGERRTFESAIGAGRAAGLPGLDLGAEKIGAGLDSAARRQLVAELAEAARQQDIAITGKEKHAERRSKEREARLDREAALERSRVQADAVASRFGSVFGGGFNTKGTADSVLRDRANSDANGRLQAKMVAEAEAELRRENTGFLKRPRSDEEVARLIDARIQRGDFDTSEESVRARAFAQNPSWRSEWMADFDAALQQPADASGERLELIPMEIQGLLNQLVPETAELVKNALIEDFRNGASWESLYVDLQTKVSAAKGAG